jgi:hypothetical protein
MHALLDINCRLGARSYSVRRLRTKLNVLGVAVPLLRALCRQHHASGGPMAGTVDHVLTSGARLFNRDLCWRMEVICMRG